MGRAEAVDAATRLVGGLLSSGLDVAVPAEDRPVLEERLGGPISELVPPRIETGERGAAERLPYELMVVLGGDGTILRGAEWVMSSDIPLLGVNLGHVGFLAEAESSEIDSIVAQVVGCSYSVEERFTIEVTLREDDEPVWCSYAINEVSIEKAARERMVELRGGGGRSSAVPLGLRRDAGGDADRLDGVRVLGRRSGDLARGGCVPGRAAERPRIVRPAAGAGAELGRRGRAARRVDDQRADHLRRAAQRRVPARDGDRGGPGSRTGCGWPGCRSRRSPIGWSASSGSGSRAGAGWPSSTDSRRNSRRARWPCRPTCAPPDPGIRLWRLPQARRVRTGREPPGSVG